MRTDEKCSVLHLLFHPCSAIMWQIGLITNTPLLWTKPRLFSAYSSHCSPTSLPPLHSCERSHSSACHPYSFNALVCCSAPLCTHISLVLRSSLLGELGSRWESSGGSSFPCASSQARSSRSFLLLARSAVGRDEKPSSTSCPHFAKKHKVLLQLSRTPVRWSCSFSKGSNSTGAAEVRIWCTINTPHHRALVAITDFEAPL